MISEGAAVHDGNQIPVGYKIYPTVVFLYLHYRTYATQYVRKYRGHQSTVVSLWDFITDYFQAYRCGSLTKSWLDIAFIYTV